MNEEMWGPIPGYEGAYEVSTRGRVRAMTRTLPDGRVRTGQMLRLTTDLRGHMRAQLWKNAKSKNFMVGRAMAVAFGLAAEDSPRWVVRYKNGDPADVNIENIVLQDVSDFVYSKMTAGNLVPVTLEKDGLETSFGSLADAARSIGSLGVYRAINPMCGQYTAGGGQGKKRAGYYVRRVE